MPLRARRCSALDQPGRLRRLAARVLDRLGLVEDGVIERVVLEVDDISPKRAVGGQDDVEVVELFPGLTAADAGMVEDAELRREASGLLLPVEDERPRHHDQRRRGSAAFPGGGPQLAARLQQGEHLDGLAQAHVVGQAAAETELPEEVEPAEAVALIAAELTLEPGRRVRGRNALELAQPLARPLEPLVESRLGLLGQQDVEQADLRPPEPKVIPLRRAHPGQGHVLLQPLLRQQAEAAVAQRHEVLAAPQGREQGGQRHLLIAEGHPAVQLEPVDPGRHLDPEVARLAVQLPLGLDAPALLEEGPRGFRQVACEQLQ